MSDLIDRQAAIDALLGITAMRNTIPLDSAIFNIKKLPSAQPERTPMQELLDTTADRDYWKAQCHSYEMTINRLTESARPEIIRCKDCRKNPNWEWVGCPMTGENTRKPDDFCSYAERREVTT